MKNFFFERFKKEPMPLTEDQLFNKLRQTPTKNSETRIKIATEIINKFDPFYISGEVQVRQYSDTPRQPIVVTATLDDRFSARFVQQQSLNPYWQISYTETGFPTISLGTHGFGVVVGVGDINFDLSQKNPNAFIQVYTDSDDTNKILNQAGITTHRGDPGIFEYHQYHISLGYEDVALKYANQQIAKLETNIVKLASKGTSPVSAHRCFNASF